MFYYYYDWTYILVLIGVVLSLLASAKVKSTFARYSNVRSYSGMTGRDAAEKILHRNGIYDVQIIHISGNLTDHYNPTNKTLALSDPVYHSTSVAAIGVAAHECGHAVQHQVGYAPLSVRSALVPAANFGSMISWPLIIIGLMFNGQMSAMLINLGILLFSLAVLFQIVTLPVEFNASHRAVNVLETAGMLHPEEISGVKKVLGAAALTYVASAAAQILQLLRLLILTRGRRDDLSAEQKCWRKKMGRQVNEREIVLAVLMEITENGAYSHKILGEVLSKYQYLEKKERAFITRVTEGTLEHLIEIDYILDQFSKVKVKKMKPVIRNILRSGVYQLKYMDSVPDHAVCSEAVKLAVRKGFSGLKGYVNGVLRSVARGLDTLDYPQEGIEALSIQYSIPTWILRLWEKSYGEEVTRTMAADFLKEKPVTIRCCQNKVTPEQLKKELEQAGVTVQEHPYLPYAFFISGYDYLESLDCFWKGWFTVQDVSSMLVAELAAPEAGNKIVDICAAPGGKSLHIAEKLWITDRNEAKKGEVEARDLTEYKVGLIEENIARMELENIHAVCRDATVPDEAWKEKADIVLADLPCSGLGVFGKKPDLKYRVKEEDLKELAGLQRKILENAQAMVKKGGTLLYSTCTIDPMENEENVHWFLKKYPQFSLDSIREKLCPQLAESVEEEGCIQLLPGIHCSDGFFIARLKKNGEN